MSKLFVMYIGLDRAKDGSALDKQAVELAIEVLKGKLADEFGGFSVGEIKGGYRMAETGALVEERALRVEVLARETQTEEVKQCAAMFRDLFMQESVLLNCTTVESNFV